MKTYVVIDTNVLVSAMLKFQSVPGEVIDCVFRGELIPLLCDEILAEYKEVLLRPKFRFRPDAVDTVLKQIVNHGIFMNAATVDEDFIDPKDVIFYAVVMEKRRSEDDCYLVTGNKKHFPVKPYVVSAKEMLEILKK